jgi:hypothetical protein
MVGRSAMATALGLSVVAPSPTRGSNSVYRHHQAPVDDDHRSNRQELIGIVNLVGLPGGGVIDGLTGNRSWQYS